MALTQSVLAVGSVGPMSGYNPATQLRVRRAMRQAGRNVKSLMRRRVRVRTGRLRSSIFTKARGYNQVVGFNEGIAPYAKYVEFGTRYFSGDYIMVRSVADEMPRTMRLLTNALFNVQG